MDYLDYLLFGENKAKTAALIGTSLLTDIVGWACSFGILYAIWS